MMKIIIIGAGVAGSVLADMLSKRGDNPIVFEKDNKPGGMCKSYYKNGFVYEYGPHILAVHNCSEKAAIYIKSKIDVIRTEPNSASYINDTVTYYPPSIFSAELLGISEKVQNEIAQLPQAPDETNFETYLRTKVGNTLYKLFFESFTRKFWGIEPKLLSADWAKIRRLGEKIDSKKMFFTEKWCAYPKKDWNELFSNILKNINVLYDAEISRINLKEKNVIMDCGNKMSFDMVISTMPIDELFNYKFEKLRYAGYRIKPVILNRKHHLLLENQPVSMTYYPGEEFPYCRVTDYGSFQKKEDFPYNNSTIITYEYSDENVRLYPFMDKENLNKFDKYLKEAANYPHLLTFGRMGLYKYLTTDTTVEMAFRTMTFFKEWMNMDPGSRYQAYKKIRGTWSN